MRFEDFFGMRFILYYFVLFCGFNLWIWFIGDRVKFGVEFIGSIYGNCVNLVMRCCNVFILVIIL